MIEWIFVWIKWKWGESWGNRWKIKKFYISATGIKRVTISNASEGGGSKGATVAATSAAAARGRLLSRTLLPVVLVLGIVLPFVFVRIAFLVLESASSSSCSSPIGNLISYCFLNPIRFLTESYYLSSFPENAFFRNSCFDGVVPLLCVFQLYYTVWNTIHAIIVAYS